MVVIMANLKERLEAVRKDLSAEWKQAPTISKDEFKHALESCSAEIYRKALDKISIGFL